MSIVAVAHARFVVAVQEPQEDIDWFTSHPEGSPVRP